MSDPRNQIPTFDEVMKPDTHNGKIPSFADIMGEEPPKKKVSLGLGGAIATSSVKSPLPSGLKSKEENYDFTSKENAEGFRKAIEGKRIVPEYFTDKDAEKEATTHIQESAGKISPGEQDPVGKLLNSPLPEYQTNDKAAGVKVFTQKLKMLNNAFSNGEEAKAYLQKDIMGRPIDSVPIEELRQLAGDNVTKQTAITRYDKQRKVEQSFDEGRATLEDAAINYAILNGDENAKMLVEKAGGTLGIPPAMKGEKVLQFLMNPDLHQLSEKYPALKEEMNTTIANFPVYHPEYATKLLADAIAKKRDEKGLNSSFANVVGKESTDKIMDELIAEGSFPANYRNLYAKTIRPKLGTWQSIGRGIGNAIPGLNQLVNEAPIPTPGILENIEQGAENFEVGTAKSIVGLTGIDPRSEAQKTYSALEKQYSTPEFEPSGLWQKATMHGGQMIPFVAGLVGGTSALKATNLIKNPSVASGLTMVLATHGDNAEKARILFPRNDTKQFLYTGVMDGLNAVVGKFLPGQNIPKLLSKGEPVIADALKAMVDGKITTDAAKSAITNFIANTAKGSLAGGEFTAAIAATDDLLTQTLQGKGIDFGQTADKTWDAFKTGTLSTVFLAGGEAALKSNKGLRSEIISMAANPEHYKELLNREAENNPELAKVKDDILSNLDYIGKVYAESPLEGSKKEKYVLDSLAEKVKLGKAELATDPTIKKQYQQEAKNLHEIKEGALKGIEPEKIIENQAIKEVKQMYNDGYLSGAAGKELETIATEGGEGKFDPDKVVPFLKQVAEGTKKAPDNIQKIADEMFPDAKSESPHEEKEVVTPEEIAEPIEKSNEDVVEPLKDVESTTKVLEQFRWDSPEMEKITELAPNIYGNHEAVAEDYHQFKKDGTNPELVKAVEDLLGEQRSGGDVVEGNPALKDVHNNNPELSKIGTEKEYAEYLKTVFHDSKVKDVVYHRSDEKFDEFDVSKSNKDTGGGVDFSDNPNETQYGKNIYPALIDIGDFTHSYDRTDNRSGSDLSYLYDKPIHSVYNKEQIHILGSKADIEGFKKWKENKKANEQATPIEQEAKKKVSIIQPEENKVGENIPLKKANENPKQLTEGNQSQSTKEKSDVDAEPPKKTVSEGLGDGGKELDKLANNIPDSGKVAEYMSKDTIEKYTGETPTNDQSRGVQELEIALNHGEKIIEKAKELFGKDYAEKTLDYIDNSTAGISNKALMYVSLENALGREKLENPERAAELTKQQALVYEQSQKFARENSLALNYQKLRRIAKAGYDIEKVTNNFFSGKELEDKQELEKAIEADADTINKEYEKKETGVDVEKAIKEGVEKEVEKLYEALPKEKQSAADRAIAALEKIQKKLRGKAYESTIGIPVAIIDAGITTIKHAIKAGVEISRAIELGIKKIKEKWGKEWPKEDEFRKDVMGAFKEEEKYKPKKSTYDIVKEALIEKGFGREIEVKGEKKKILDWKKLAGAAGTISKIRENVNSVLQEKGLRGLTDTQKGTIKEDFLKEYIDLRASVIEKAQNELAKRNKENITPNQKTAAKKLAELYTYGLFESTNPEYENTLIKALGAKVSIDGYQEAKLIAKSMETFYSTTFKGVKLNDISAKAAIEKLEDRLRILLYRESKKQGNFALRAAGIVRNYLEIQQTMILNNLKQAVENPFSGLQQAWIDKIEGMVSGTSTPEMASQRRKLMTDVYKDMVLNGGIGYGKIESQFVNRQHLDDYVNKLSDNQIYHGIMSTITGKLTLNAMDAMFKAGLTAKKFSSNLIRILTDETNPQRMGKEDAVKFVSEKLTGQTFKDAQVNAADIIEKINKDAGKELISPTQTQIDRLASDIVKSALEMGGKLTTEQITAAYNAAYKAAGLGLGHEANNPLSAMLKGYSAKLEGDINRALKDKEWNRAAALTMKSSFIRNVLNPFVGGGTNWLVLKLEKTGLGLVTGLVYQIGSKKRIDLSTKEGLKHLEARLYNQSRYKDNYMRGAVGGAASLLTYVAFLGIAGTDDYRKWRAKNPWAARYLDVVTPEALLAQMAIENKQVERYVGQSFNRNDAFDASTKLVKAGAYLSKGKKNEAIGALGEAIGSKFNLPLPWRLVKDGQVIYQGVTGQDPYHGNYKPSTGFLNGVFQGGAIEWLGLRPSGSGATSTTERKSRKTRP